MVEEFFALWFRAGRVSYSSNSSSSRRSRALAAPTDWLHASFLQLVDKLLQKPLLHVAPGVVMHAMVAGVSVGAANPMVHPQLAAAAGQAPDPALAAQVAAALQQVGAGEARDGSMCMQAVLAAAPGQQSHLVSCCLGHCMSILPAFCWWCYVPPKV
jgi:hypothetical protein